jgi:hypothetical protein
VCCQAVDHSLFQLRVEHGTAIIKVDLKQHGQQPSMSMTENVLTDLSQQQQPLVASKLPSTAPRASANRRKQQSLCTLKASRSCLYCSRRYQRHPCNQQASDQTTQVGLVGYGHERCAYNKQMCRGGSCHQSVYLVNLLMCCCISQAQIGQQLRWQWL